MSSGSVVLASTAGMHTCFAGLEINKRSGHQTLSIKPLEGEERKEFKLFQILTIFEILLHFKTSLFA